MKKVDVSGVQLSNNEKYPSAGGYVCGIYDIVEKEEYGLFEIYIDIIEGEFKGFYSNKVKEGRKSLPKYTLFYNGEYAEKNIKGFATSVNGSNDGTVINEKSIDTAEIMKAKKKKIGMVFREKQYENNNGGISTTVEPFIPHTVDTIKSGDFKMPEMKMLNTSVGTSGLNTGFAQSNDDPFGSSSNDGFMNIPDNIEDDGLPF